MRVLAHHYHPIVEDFCLSLSKHLKFSVDCAIKIDINDHYGSHAEILKQNQSKYSEFKSIPYTQALVQLKAGLYDLIFLDGVYDGDKQIVDLCNQKNIPYVAISGYPFLRDEAGAKNILSFSWFMPQVQFLNQFPTEGHVKQQSLDVSSNKNICIFYPEFSYAKQFAKENPRLLSAVYHEKFCSFIHRFEECNPQHYKHFKDIESKLGQEIPNYTGLTQGEVLYRMNHSRGLVLTKWADAPGIALFEAQLLGVTPFVFQQYVLASFNQEVLIDGMSAVTSNSDDEFVSNLRSDKWAKLSASTQQHAMMITDFGRQQDKLEKFIQKCLQL